MYKIYNEDCLVAMDRLIEQDTLEDCILTDPPYGRDFVSNYRKDKYNKIANDDNCNIIRETFYRFDKILKDNSHIYCFCSWHNIDIFKVEFEKYFKLKNIIIWNKNNTSMGDLKGSYAPKYEMILFGHKGRRIRNGFRYPDVIEANRTGNKLHPTQKPVDLLKIFVEQSTNEGETVLDSFMGSGSTGVACLDLNRKFIGMELDSEFFNISQCRLSEIKKKF